MRAPDTLNLRVGGPVGTNPGATGDLVAAGIALVAALLH
jgi:hypothetical protein